MDQITIMDENGESIDFYVLEESRINGTDYILVTDSEADEDGEAYILRDCSEESDAEAVYEFVEDDTELEALYKVFGELLEDVEIEI